MYNSAWAFLCAYTAALAFCVIYNSHIMYDLYSVKRTILFTDFAAYAARLAVLINIFADFGIRAYNSWFAFLWYKFNDLFGTCIYTLPAGCTFALINNSYTVLYWEGAEFTYRNTWAETQAAAWTAFGASGKLGCMNAALNTFIFVLRCV